MMANKIAGARKKFQRVYELDFLDAPLVIGMDDESPQESATDSPNTTDRPLAWWQKDENGKHVQLNDAFEYVINSTKGKDYDAIMGFSQGGLLGTALVLTGAFPKVKAVLTAGSPFVEDVFQCAESLAMDHDTIQRGKSIPKLHFAGETDSMVPVESTKTLCDQGGNGRFVLHEKGHLFPTKAQYVNLMLDFFEKALQGESEINDL
jgi:predicted esterase